MKALSLTQPWASLVAEGLKRVETRSWPTQYRGLLAIHASLGFPRFAQDLCLSAPFYDDLRGAGHGLHAEWSERGATLVHDLPLGKIIAVVRLVDCLTITGNELNLRSHRAHGRLFTYHEELYGDYSARRFAWIFAEIKNDGDTYKFTEPIPAKGYRGLWNWQPEYDSALLLGGGHGRR